MSVQLLLSSLHLFLLGMHACTAPFAVASCSFLSGMHVCTAPFAVASCSFFIGHAHVYSSFRCCFMQLLYRTCTCVQLLSLLLHAAFLSDMHVCTAPFAVASRSFFIGHARVYSSFRCCLTQL